MNQITELEMKPIADGNEIMAKEVPPEKTSGSKKLGAHAVAMIQSAIRDEAIRINPAAAKGQAQFTPGQVKYLMGIAKKKEQQATHTFKVQQKARAAAKRAKQARKQGRGR